MEGSAGIEPATFGTAAREWRPQGDGHDARAANDDNPYTGATGKDEDENDEAVLAGYLTRPHQEGANGFYNDPRAQPGPVEAGAPRHLVTGGLQPVGGQYQPNACSWASAAHGEPYRLSM